MGGNETSSLATPTCRERSAQLIGPSTGWGADTPRGPGTPGVTALRLNAAQPLPPSPAKPGVGKTRDRPGASGAALPKRQNGTAGARQCNTDGIDPSTVPELYGKPPSEDESSYSGKESSFGGTTGIKATSGFATFNNAENQEGLML